MSQATTKIQFRIQLYSIISILLTATIVSFFVFYPLYNKLRDIEKRDLFFARDASILIVDSYMSRIRDIAKQISSRTKAMMLTESYQQPNGNTKTSKQFLSKILTAALHNSAHLVGISRYTAKNQLILTVGQSPIFDEKFKSQLRTIKVHGPFFHAGRYFVTAIAPIYSPSGKYLGYDNTHFDVTDLQAKIQQKVQYRLGEIIIAYIVNGKLKYFIRQHGTWRELLISNNVLLDQLSNSIIKKQQGIMKINAGSDTVFVAYAPVHEVNWSIAVIVKQSVLFGQISSIIWQIITMVLVIIILFAFGLIVTLRPLSGRIVMYEEELTEEIKQARADLERANNKLKHLANQDALTSLLNRRGFEVVLERELSRAERYGTTFSILFIDLNKFKPINDEFGHDAGDAVLAAVSKYLENSVRAEDVVARLGGDEFVVLLTNASASVVPSIVEKIQRFSETPIAFNDKKLYCSLSIGVASYPDDGVTVADLIQKADEEMYKNKKQES